jgi:putative colanic acid biosysnthesis UDP-glucose lipid carrier transferase
MSVGAQNRRFQLTISSRVIPGVIATIDSAFVLLSGFVIWYVIIGDPQIVGDRYMFAVAFVWLVSLMLMNFAGLYEFEAIMRPRHYIDKLVVAYLTTFLFLFAVAFSLKVSSDFSRVWIAAFSTTTCTLIIAGRFVGASLIGHLAGQKLFTRNLLVVGDGEQAAQFLDRAAEAQGRFVTILGVFAVGGHDSLTLNGSHGGVGRIAELTPYIRNHKVDDVVIALPWSDVDSIAELIAELRELPVNVYLAQDLIGVRWSMRAPPAHYADYRVVEIIDSPLSGWSWGLKVVLDYGLGIVLMIAALPLMCLIAIVIKLESRGPIFFRQARYGFKNEIFHIWKFRTMRVLPQSEETTHQATRNDPRVTRVGRFLRRTSLDELPQLFNILNGSMSLIGPRPHAVDHNESFAKLIDGYFARHRVKPGITGWAQVNGFRGETRTVDLMAQRVKHDVYYAENWTLSLDLRILLMTVYVCLTGKNAY